jgi:hypothetical protein
VRSSCFYLHLHGCPLLSGPHSFLTLPGLGANGLVGRLYTAAGTGDRASQPQASLRDGELSSQRSPVHSAR